jgi:coatomer subunit beta'
VSSYVISLGVIEYQTAILRGDLEAAEALLPSVPENQRNRVARFLESQGE